MVPSPATGTAADSIQIVSAIVGTWVRWRRIRWVPQPQDAAATSISSVPSGLPASLANSEDSSSSVPANAAPMPHQ